jgi:hypothetical protein
MKIENSKNLSSRLTLGFGSISYFAVMGLLLAESLHSLPTYAQSGACYAMPFGAVKTGVAVKVAAPIDAALKKDVPASLVTEKQPLSDVPREISRIRRGYISGFVSAYPNAQPAKSWFGVDLERKAAYSIERYTYGAHDPKLKMFPGPELNATTWIRKWVGNERVEIEVVKYLPGNVGATNFDSFVCSANALWASNLVSKKSGFTDALSAYAYVVDVSADGKHSYLKQVTSWDAVDDAILGIRARMR